MPKVIHNVSKRIVDAAIKVYHEDGFEHISMRRIARESGLAIGTLYNRFEDKEALLAHVLSGDIEAIRKNMIENVFGKAPADALAVLGDPYFCAPNDGGIARYHPLCAGNAVTAGICAAHPFWRVQPDPRAFAGNHRARI